MSDFVTKDNMRIYYEEHGEKDCQPVVLVHGLCCSHQYFKYQIPALREKYHVVAYDLRGHGASDRICRDLTIPQCAEDLAALIEHLKLERVVLIGWSLGVNIVLSYVEKYGCGNVSKIVLIDNTPKMLIDEDWPYGVYTDYRNMVEGFLFMSTSFEKYVMNGVGAFFGEGAEIDEEEYAWVVRQFLDNDPGCVLTMFVNNSAGDVRGGLQRINVPTLLTYGKFPSYCTKEIMEGVAGYIPGSRVEGFSGGHLHMMQDRENFNRVLLDFLENGNS